MFFWLFLVWGLRLAFLIHFRLCFSWVEIRCSFIRDIYWKKNKSPFSAVCFWNLWRAGWLQRSGLVSQLCVLLHWLLGLICASINSVLSIRGLWLVLMCNTVVPPTLFFLLKVWEVNILKFNCNIQKKTLASWTMLSGRRWGTCQPLVSKLLLFTGGLGFWTTKRIAYASYFTFLK